MTLSGTDTGDNPDGTTQPMSGEQIEISGQPLVVTGPNPDVITATTGTASGHYSVQGSCGTGQHPAAGRRGTGPARPGAGLGRFDAAFSPLAPVTIEPDPTRITNFSYRPHTRTSAAPVTISGDVSFESGGNWLPVASQPIDSASAA